MAGGMRCPCGNKKTWRDMQVTSAGVTATCDRCGEQVSTVGQAKVSKVVIVPRNANTGEGS